MKKKFLSFMLAMCFIFPASLVLSACGDDDDEEPPKTPTNLEILNTAIDNLDDILENTTLTITPQLQYVAGIMKTYGGNDYTITYKLDGDNEEITMPETIEGGGTIFVDEYDNSYSTSAQEPAFGYMISANKGVDTQSGLLDVSELDETISDMSDTAHFYQSNPVKVVEDNGKKYISLDLDLGTRLNNALLVNYRTNHNKPIAYFINTLLSDLSKREIDIVELFDDFAIDMTNDTTVLDFIDYVAQEMDTTTDDIVENINEMIDLINLYMKVSEADLIRVAYSGGDELMSGASEAIPHIDVSEYDEMCILPLLNSETDGNFTGYDLSDMFVYYVYDDDTAITLDEALDYAYGEDADVIAGYLESTTINMLGINTKINLGSNGKPESILFTLTGNGLIKQDSTTYIPVSVNGTCSVAISEVGTTEVNLPVTGKIAEYYVLIQLTEAEFNGNTYQTTLNSSLLPEAFNITINGTIYATYNAITRVLTIDLSLIRQAVADYYGDITYRPQDMYSLIDEDICSIAITKV